MTAKSGNAQRVLDMSADLFNRFGIEAVSAGQIAEALRISPGNLTYHFRKKSDLVAEHVRAFELHLKQGIDRLMEQADPATFSAAYIEFLRITMPYRFLFISANYIIQNDLLPVARYRKLIDNTQRIFVLHFHQLMKSGLLKTIDQPRTVETLVDTLWWQWMGWLIFMQIAPKTQRPSEKKLLAEGALHLCQVVQHYVEPAFLKKLQADLRKFGSR